MIFAASALAFAADEQPALVLKTEGDRTSYQIGERIPLELSFTGPGKEQFEINLVSYKRNGCMSHEQFVVDPQAGWSDPLAVYFGSQGVIIGCGITGFGPLSPTPTVIHVNLNDWVRFEEPGSYTVTARSERLSEKLPKSQPLSLGSNPIHLTIVSATTLWQDAKLKAIVSELSQAKPDNTGDLRFLGTAAAAEVMVQHVRDDEPNLTYQCALGLMGLPEPLHPQAVTAMKKLVLDPGFPISSWFAATLAVLQIAADAPDKRAEFNRLSDATWKFVMEALPVKQRRARAQTVQTLLNNHLAMTRERRVELAGMLSASLADLPADQQVFVLKEEWDSIKSAHLLPTLKQLAQKPLENPWSYASQQQKSIALQRWYQLDPDGARQEAIRQIGSAHPSVTAESLYFLGNQSFPQFEGIWADAFRDATEYQQELALASLLVHYGTGKAVAIVREKAESKTGPWRCGTQGAALAYLVRFDPASARPLLERAIQSFGKTGCHYFQDIAHFSHNAMLREIAVQSLTDPDPRMTLEAVSYLTSYGAAADQMPISDRYAKWSQQWRGRADELESRKAGSRNGPEIGLGQSLARALIANQGWLASEKLIQTTVEQCVGDQMCQQVKEMAARARAKPYSISASQFGEAENYKIAQYSAKSFDLLAAKISQFPKGSRFVINDSSSDSEEQKQLNGRVKALLEKQGMVAEPAKTPEQPQI